jgi:hypothetical protein
MPALGPTRSVLTVSPVAEVPPMILALTLNAVENSRKAHAIKVKIFLFIIFFNLINNKIFFI